MSAMQINQNRQYIDRNEDYIETLPFDLSEKLNYGTQGELLLLYSNRHAQNGQLAGEELAVNPYTNGATTNLYLNKAHLFLNYNLLPDLNFIAEVVRDYHIKVNSDNKSLLLKSFYATYVFNNHLFLKLGQQYLNFSIRNNKYYLAPIRPSISQQLSESYNPAAVIGFFNDRGGIEVYLYQTPYRFDNVENGPNNPFFKPSLGGGIDIQYMDCYKDLHYNLIASVLSDMAVPTIIYQTVGTVINQTHKVHRQTPGLSLALVLRLYGIKLENNFVYALARFHPDDIPLLTQPAVVTNNVATYFYTQGAKPLANSTELGYIFQINDIPTYVYTRFQFSQQSQGIRHPHFGEYAIPKQTVDAGINFTITPNILWRIQYEYNKDYERSAGASGNSRNMFMTSIAYLFSDSIPSSFKMSSTK
jgi:hypothetical protein